MKLIHSTNYGAEKYRGRTTQMEKMGGGCRASIPSQDTPFSWHAFTNPEAHWTLLFKAFPDSSLHRHYINH